MEYEEICEKIQGYLSDPPLIVWGSGATIGFGLPSMGSLLNDLKAKGLLEPDAGDDLEKELGREVYESRIDNIRKLIKEKVSEANNSACESLLTNASPFEGIRLLTKLCVGTDVKKMDVVSTNYDLILENVWGYYDYQYTDGFQQDLNLYHGDNFKEKNTINLYKVHGSINWYKIGNTNRKCSKNIDGTPVMIPPGKRKYEWTYDSPYRELIQLSDKAIENHKSFLVVGFGFNDHHLTTKIRENSENGKPIVVVTKNVTNTTKNELSNAKKKIYVEEDPMDSRKTLFTIIEKGKILAKQSIDGTLWKLENFMKILCPTDY